MTTLADGPRSRPAVEGTGWPPHRARLQAILDGHDAHFGRTVALAIQALIVLSIITISASTMPGMPDWAQRAFGIEETVVVSVFAVEYLLRLYAAENRLRYATSFLGIVDLVAVAPSLLALGFDARALRAFRVFRIFQLLKLMRYSRALDRLQRAFVLIRAELGIFLLLASITLYLCAAFIYFFEHDAQPDKFQSIPHSLWWAVATLTTVGYGDVYPITTGGRIFTGLVLLLGLGVVAVPVGLISAALSSHEGPDGGTGRPGAERARPPAGREHERDDA